MKSKPPIPISGKFNVSALAREHGVSRSTIRRRLANGWTPVVAHSVLPPVPPAGKEQPGLAAVLLIVAIGIAALALVINAQAGSSVGFLELHTSDTAVGRRAIEAASTAVADQRRAAIAVAELAANAARKAREAECEIRGPRRRDRESDERTALARLTNATATPFPAPATIADPDPQVMAAQRLANWIGFDVSAAGVVNLRLALVATLPNIAGLVLAFGSTLRGRAT